MSGLTSEENLSAEGSQRVYNITLWAFLRISQPWWLLSVCNKKRRAFFPGRIPDFPISIQAQPPMFSILRNIPAQNKSKGRQQWDAFASSRANHIITGMWAVSAVIELSDRVCCKVAAAQLSSTWQHFCVLHHHRFIHATVEELTQCFLKPKENSWHKFPVFFIREMIWREHQEAKQFSSPAGGP